MIVEEKTEIDGQGNDYTVVRVYLDSGKVVRVTESVLVVEQRREDGGKVVNLLHRLKELND